MEETLVTELLFADVHLPLESFTIYDADWTMEYGLLVILKVHQQRFILWDGQTYLLPEGMNHPMIRWINKGSILVVNSMNDIFLSNALIMRKDGGVHYSFAAGNAIEDVVVGEEGIWISYFDEDNSENERLILYDFEGDLLLRYPGDFPESPYISNCNSLVKGTGTSTWLFSYPDSFLIQVDPYSRSTIFYVVPEALCTATAISVHNNRIYFNMTSDSKEEIWVWEIGTFTVRKIGEAIGFLRGLVSTEEVYFLSVSALTNEVLLYSIQSI